MKTQELCESLLTRLKEKEYMEQRLKDLNKKIAETTMFLNEAMFNDNCDKHSVEGIEFKPIEEQDFFLKETEDGLKWDDSERFFKWLEGIDAGGIIRTKKTVPWNTRKKFLKEHLEAGDKLPDFIGEKFFNTVKWNKSAVARLVKADIEANEKA